LKGLSGRRLVLLVRQRCVHSDHMLYPIDVITYSKLSIQFALFMIALGWVIGIFSDMKMW
jgi:hypothetical protein